jgi:sec-independent protein translocase protein TatA
MFGAKSLVHWIIVLGVFLLLFGGRNKISNIMGDIGKGIKSFRKGLNEDTPADGEVKAQPPIGLEYQGQSRTSEMPDQRRSA